MEKRKNGEPSEVWLETKKVLDATYFTYQALLFCNQHVYSIYKDSKGDKRLHHYIGKSKFSFWLSDLLKDKNRNTMKAIFIVESIVLLTGILEYYLEDILRKYYKQSENMILRRSGRKIFGYFSKVTGIQLSKLPEYPDINKFWDVRNDALKNLGKVGKNLGRHKLPLGSKIVLFPQGVTLYYRLLDNFMRTIDNKAKSAN